MMLFLIFTQPSNNNFNLLICINVHYMLRIIIINKNMKYMLNSLYFGLISLIL